jgi:hypothetical protein
VQRLGVGAHEELAIAVLIPERDRQRDAAEASDREHRDVHLREQLITLGL